MTREALAGERPRVGIGVMLLKGGRVLLGRRKGSHGAATFGWVGGHLEFGESFEECARREVYEETGLEVSTLRFLCVSNIVDYGKHYVDIEFIADITDGEPRVTEPDRVEGWNWYELDQLPTPLFRPVELAVRSYSNREFYNP